MSLSEHYNTAWRLTFSESGTGTGRRLRYPLTYPSPNDMAAMPNKYFYRPVWSGINEFVELRTFLADQACYHLDYADEVSWFSRNRETLLYTLEGKPRRLTPEIVFTLNGQQTYLHCFRSGTFTQAQANALKAQQPIYFWNEKIILTQRLNNIKLIRRYYVHNQKTGTPAEARLAAFKLHCDVVLTPRNMADFFDEEHLGEANVTLMEVTGKGLVSFDIDKPLTEHTVFTFED